MKSLTTLVATIMAATTVANAQSSTRQERFEAFAEARIVRGELPISALTRQQQADFGVEALISFDSAVRDALGDLVDVLNSSQFDQLINSSSLLAESFATSFNAGNYQSIDLLINRPRIASQAFTTVRSLRRSGLIRRGANRFNRPEFRENLGSPLNEVFQFTMVSAEISSSDYEDIVSGIGFSVPLLLSADIFPSRFIPNVARLIANDLIEGAPRNGYPNDVEAIDEIVTDLLERTLRLRRTLLRANPNFGLDI